MVELPRRAIERALGRERAKVQFVENDVVPGQTRPGLAEGIGLRVDKLARTMHVVWLEARGRIGDKRPVAELKPVERARADPLDDCLEETVGAALHRRRFGRVREHEADPILVRRPQTETDRPALERGPMRPSPALSHLYPAPPGENLCQLNLPAARKFQSAGRGRP